MQFPLSFPNYLQHRTQEVGSSVAHWIAGSFGFYGFQHKPTRGGCSCLIEDRNPKDRDLLVVKFYTTMCGLDLEVFQALVFQALVQPSKVHMPIASLRGTRSSRHRWLSATDTGQPDFVLTCSIWNTLKNLATWNANTSTSKDGVSWQCLLMFEKISKISENEISLL